MKKIVMETLIRYEKVKDIIIKNIIFKDGYLSKKKNACINIFRSSRPEMFLRKGVLKIRSKFTGEHPWKHMGEPERKFSYVKRIAF